MSNLIISSPAIITSSKHRITPPAPPSPHQRNPHDAHHPPPSHYGVSNLRSRRITSEPFPSPPPSIRSSRTRRMTEARKETTDPLDIQIMDTPTPTPQATTSRGKQAAMSAPRPRHDKRGETTRRRGANRGKAKRGRQGTSQDGKQANRRDR